MIVTHEIRLDLTKREETAFLEAMQDDRYCRNLAVSMYAGAIPWNPPDGSRAVVRFRKADGTGGEYDTLPDGIQAYSVSGNILNVVDQ